MKGVCSISGALTALVILLCMGAVPAFAAHPFELDGNATSSATLPGTDWDDVNGQNGDNFVDARTGLITDRPEPHQGIFHGGGSKDEQDISNWGWRNGSPPDKDDIEHAYAAAVTDDNGHFIIVFGMDRFDTSGDAQLGFWFFQDQVEPVGTGNTGGWQGHHQVGDVLVLANFTTGGTTPEIQVFEWNGTTAVPVTAPDEALCTGGWIPSGFNHCGITNGTSVPAPWDYTNKDVGSTSQFPPGAFFEGAIDLTELGIDACFTRFMAESRSSQSITATLKDFANSGFPVCSVSVTKACTNGRLTAAQDGFIYDIKGKVSNSGHGTLYNVRLSDSPAADGAFQEVDCETGAATGNTFPLGSLTGETCYQATMTVPLNQNGVSDTVTATANTSSDLSGTDLSDTATATCPTVPVSANLSVSKDCVSTVEALGGKVVAKVSVSGQVCNTGESNLTNVTVTDTGFTTSPSPLLSGVSLLSGDCTSYSGTYYPSAANDSDGNPTTCPANVVFKDTVKATATDIFGNSVPKSGDPDVTDMATCPLCAGEGCPTP